MPDPKPSVFISYSSVDRQWVEAFTLALQNAGVAVWLDLFELTPGDNMREALETALATSDFFVPVVGEGSFASPNIMFELGAAVAKGKTVLPLVVEGSNQERMATEAFSRIAHIKVKDPQSAATRLVTLMRDLDSNLKKG